MKAIPIRTPDIPVPFAHQSTTTQFIVDNPKCFVANDPGTGKTRSVIDAFEAMRPGKMLVLAPLSILDPSWACDIRKFAPNARFAIAHGNKKKREAALRSNVDYVITNHDAVKWLLEQPKEVWDDFTHIVVDESTAFKNRTAQRSKALRALAMNFDCRVLMSGTPNTGTVCDLWHQYLIIDEGARLGKDFYKFQNMMCIGEIQHKGGNKFTKWQDRDDASDIIADMVKDITVRFRFEDCIDIPENSMSTMTLEMPPWLEKKYKELRDEGVLEHGDEVINPVHAGAKIKKMLQLLSGALYNEDGDAVKVHKDRYQLVMELVQQRKQSLVAFNWRHELASLKEIADKLKIPYAEIHGGVKKADRDQAVKDFQDGKLQVIFAHPQSAGHGLTLTKGTATIWASPTYNAEHYQQFNRRIYRAGQTQKTETIRIAYADSKEIDVYSKLDGKLDRMEDLLDLFTDLTKIRSAA